MMIPEFLTLNPLRCRIVIRAVAGFLLLGGLTPGCSPSSDGGSSEPSVGLTGIVVHDFGIVDLEASGGRVQHTFLLRNSSDATIRIIDRSSTCGCTDVEIDREDIAAGQSLAVNSTLNLSDSGPKVARITLLTDSVKQTSIVLTLQATGRWTRRLTSTRLHVDIEQGQTETITLFVIDYDRESSPPMPLTTTPDGLIVSFGDWILIERRNADSGLPARWEGVVSIAIDEPTNQMNSHLGRLTIELPEMPKLKISVQIVAPS